MFTVIVYLFVYPRCQS